MKRPVLQDQKRRYLKLCLLIVSIVASIAVAITPAGTLIRNQASAKLGDETYLSNEVETTVKAICIPELGLNGSPQEPGQSVSVATKGFIYLPYSLTNAGNERFDFDLSWALHSSSAWTPARALLHLDSNGNGSRDAGEKVIEQISLASGQSIKLILAVEVPENAAGDVLITPVASCEGNTDSDNYGRVRIVTGAALQAFKSASPQKANPGDTVTYDLKVINVGAAATSTPVTLTDLLTSGDFEGLEYQTGSANAPKGQLEFYDGSTWLTNEPSNVKGIRITVSTLQVSEEASLSFSMIVSDTALSGTRTNLVSITGDGGPTQVSTDIEVLPIFKHHLGPLNNPRAKPEGEASSSDEQNAPLIIFGQPLCFGHSLENAGNSRDNYLISFSELPEGLSVSLQQAGGTVFPNPVELEPGEVRNFEACYIVSELIDAFTISLSAASLTNGATNITRDRVNSPVTGRNLGLIKTVDKEGSVQPNDVLTYTLTVENNNPYDLNDVTVYDVLRDFINQKGRADPDLKTRFVSASHDGSYNTTSHTVSWHFDKISKGETLELKLLVQMPAESPFGSVFTLANNFSLEATELPTPLQSNNVFNGFPIINVLIEKDVTPKIAYVGDVLHYSLVITNPNDVAMELIVDDLPAPRLAYIPGTAVLKMGDIEKQLEPAIIEGSNKMTWDLRSDPDFEIAARNDAKKRDQLFISYDMVIQPGAESPLVNTAITTASYEIQEFIEGELQTQAVALSVSSFEVSVIVIIPEGDTLTSPNALLAGRVYLDLNEDGHFDDTDIPLPGARVLLANGWQILTDTQGRYSFRNILPGPWSVMLDPSSAPYLPLPHPEALGAGYRHHLVAQGLSVTDFPLKAPDGLIDAYRETVLVFGPLRLEKKLIPLPRGVRIVLSLESEQALPDLLISDPIPNEPDRSFSFESFQGETMLSYDLPESIPLTDPNARWRYP